MKNIFGLILLSFLIVGCEGDIDVPFLSDADEIERYIADDDLGEVFFSTENLLVEQPYLYPLDSTGYYVDLLDSIDREIISYFPLQVLGAGYGNPSQEFGPPFGSSQDAEVEVRDRVFGRTIRIEGVDTTLVNVLVFRDYNRYGYFMKLGDDGQKFSGWILRGFSSGNPDIITGDIFTGTDIYHADGQRFPGFTDHYSSTIYDNSSTPAVKIVDITTRKAYQLLNEDQSTNQFIAKAAKGELLRAEVTSTYGVFSTMSYKTDDTTLLRNFTLNNNSQYDVLIPTALVSSKTWDFIYFQEFVREATDSSDVPKFQTLKRRNWVIPFKPE